MMWAAITLMWRHGDVSNNLRRVGSMGSAFTDQFPVRSSISLCETKSSMIAITYFMHRIIVMWGVILMGFHHEGNTRTRQPNPQSDWDLNSSGREACYRCHVVIVLSVSDRRDKWQCTWRWQWRVLRTTTAYSCDELLFLAWQQCRIQ